MYLLKRPYYILIISTLEQADGLLRCISMYKEIQNRIIYLTETVFTTVITTKNKAYLETVHYFLLYFTNTVYNLFSHILCSLAGRWLHFKDEA